MTSNSRYIDYPYGMVMPGRHGQAADVYRYGYQGSERDNEVKGQGNSYTTHFRQLDPRIGRWLTIDPKMSAWESPYVSMGNSPILYNDIFGDVVGVEGTKKEQRQVNRIIKKGIKNSETFKKVYESLDQSPNLHIIRTGEFTNKEGLNAGSNLVIDGDQDPNNEKGAKSIMYVNLGEFDPKGMDDFSGEGPTVSKSQAKVFGLGHELGHQYMKDKEINYERQSLILPTIENPSPSLRNPDLRIKNPEYSSLKNSKIMLDNVNNTHFFNELGASMIENKIRTDLKSKLRTQYKTDLKSSLGSTFNRPYTIDVINDEKKFLPNGLPIGL